MKKTVFRCQEYLGNSIQKFAFVGILVMLFTAFSSNVQAQTQTATAGNRVLSNKHQVYLMAQNLGITVSTLGGWDVEKVLQTLQTKLQVLDPNSSDTKVKFMYIYYVTTIQDIRDYSISPEISLVKRLVDVKVKVHNGNPLSNSFLKSFYRDVTQGF